MEKKRIKNWYIKNQFDEADTIQVKTHSLGDIRVIPPSKTEDTDYTVVGVISTARKKHNKSKTAVLVGEDDKKADVFSQLYFSKLVGYLPTSVDEMYIAVRKPRFGILLLISAVIVSLVTTGAVFIASTQAKPASEKNIPEIETELSDLPKSPEQIKDEKPNVTLPGWGALTIAADTTDVTLNFGNPDKNAGYYYISFELLLKNGDETESLYKSGLVEPGKYITDVTLNRSLPAGEYDAVVHMQPYTMSDPPTETNCGDVDIKLIVK